MNQKWTRVTGAGIVALLVGAFILIVSYSHRGHLPKKAQRNHSVNRVNTVSLPIISLATTGGGQIQLQ